MTMKVKAIEKKLKFTKDPNDPGVYRYVMQPERREVEPDYHPPHHLHARRGPEGRAEEHRRADYLLRPRRQGGEARDQR